jgi:hypothetical protein
VEVVYVVLVVVLFFGLSRYLCAEVVTSLSEFLVVSFYGDVTFLRHLCQSRDVGNAIDLRTQISHSL